MFVMLDWPAGPASSVAVVSRNDCKNYLFIFSGESGGDRTDCSVTPSEGEQPDWREVRELSSAKLVITQVNILHGSPQLPHITCWGEGWANICRLFLSPPCSNLVAKTFPNLHINPLDGSIYPVVVG